MSVIAPYCNTHSVSDVGIPVLLTHLLLTLRRDVEGTGSPAPSLLLWSSLLRFASDEAVAVRDLPSLARLSRRAVRASIGTWEQRGVIVLDGKTVTLTPEGQALREEWRSRLEAAEQRWRTRLGRARTDALRHLLPALVARFDLELPHYPTPYGPSDPRITGGTYAPAKEGPPRIPARGQDWLPVPRERVDDNAKGAVASLPLPALVSQALIAFTIDYESRSAPLPFVANLLRGIPDAGVPLSATPPMFAITGTGKSGLERHGFVTVSKRGVVKLTAISRRVRDAHDGLVAGIEAQWRDRYGDDTVTAVRAALEAVVGKLDPNLPDHPMVVWRPGIGFADVSDELVALPAPSPAP